MNSVEQNNLKQLHRFRNFLRDRLGLEQSEMPTQCEWAHTANTLCALALRCGLLSWEQAEEVLEKQANSNLGEKVGEIAVELGYLTNEQVGKLLEVQVMNLELMFGQQLVLSGILDLSTLMRIVSEFLDTVASEEAVSSEAEPMAFACR